MRAWNVVTASAVSIMSIGSNRVDGSRRYLRVGCGVGITIVTAMVSCGCLSVIAVLHEVVHAPSAGSTAPVRVPLSGPVVVGFDDETISYTDAQEFCRDPEISATETGTEVMLTLTDRNDRSFADCARFMNVLPQQTIVVGLTQPLGKRRLVDAVSGLNVAVFRQRDALRPKRFPPGYTVIGDSTWGRVTTAVSDFGDATSPTIGEAFTLAGSSVTAPVTILWVVQTIGTGWHPAPGTPTVPVVVRGRPGLAAPGIIVWTERGRTIAIRWDPPAGSAPASTRTLIAIAAGLG